MASSTEMIHLRSSQGEVFEVESAVACMSNLIQNMVEDGGVDEEIPLPNVKTAILAKVIEYCKHHKENPPDEITKPLKSTSLAECGVSDWDCEFVNIEQVGLLHSLDDPYYALLGDPFRVNSSCELFGHQASVGPAPAWITT